MGEARQVRENASGGRRKKLIEGVTLILRYPEVAARDCEHCKKWVYDEETGRPKTSGVSKRLVPRGAAPPPCRLSHVGCPKGTPENPRTLSDRNRQAYEHYQECRAVSQFPDDSIVRRNARLIRLIEDAVALGRQRSFERLVSTIAMRGACG